MVMAMRAGVMPATLHAEQPSDQGDWAAGEVQLLTEARGWDARGEGVPRRAAASSFGISGTNAHVILEQGDPDPAPVVDVEPESEGRPVAWLVSAKTPTGLRAQAGRLAAWSQDVGIGADVADVAAALAARSRFAHRGVVTGVSRADLVAGLRA